MAALKGRSVVIKWNGTAVAGVRTKSITINGSPIDVTTDDDSGIRALLDTPGQLEVNISCSGIALNDTLRQAALSSTDRTAPFSYLYAGTQGSPAQDNGFSGDFYLASYTETGEYQGAVTFEATFQSNGVVSYTPRV